MTKKKMNVAVAALLSVGSVACTAGTTHDGSGASELVSTPHGMTALVEHTGERVSVRLYTPDGSERSHMVIAPDGTAGLYQDGALVATFRGAISVDHRIAGRVEAVTEQLETPSFQGRAIFGDCGWYEQENDDGFTEMYFTCCGDDENGKVKCSDHATA